MSGALDLVVRNWHFVGVNYSQNVSTSRTSTNESTGVTTGTVTLLSSIEVTVEADLIPPLDPNDTVDPTGTVQNNWINPAEAPSSIPTSAFPSHGCYVDLNHVFWVRLLGAHSSSIFFGRPNGTVKTPWRLHYKAHPTGYYNEQIPVVTWRAVFSATGRKSVANATWTGQLNPDRFRSLWPES